MSDEPLQQAKATAPKGDSQWMGHAVLGMVCAIVIGMFAWSGESGLLLVRPRAENSYYNLLVQGFRAGQISLDQEAPPGLTQLANPYDPAANAAYMGYVGDMSYYKGKLYLYFGVTPALVLFWPYVIMTDDYLSDADAVVIFLSLGFLVAAGLLRAVWRRYFSEVSVWVPVVGILTLGLALGAQEVEWQFCSVYHVALSCAFAFTMLALAALWCALHDSKRQVLWLSLASLAYGLTRRLQPRKRPARWPPHRVIRNY